jgi:hypothetical protein
MVEFSAALLFILFPETPLDVIVVSGNIEQHNRDGVVYWNSRVMYARENCTNRLFLLDLLHKTLTFHVLLQEKPTLHGFCCTLDSKYDAHCQFFAKFRTFNI